VVERTALSFINVGAVGPRTTGTYSKTALYVIVVRVGGWVLKYYQPWPTGARALSPCGHKETEKCCVAPSSKRIIKMRNREEISDFIFGDLSTDLSIAKY
jgi:hypothetical protein